jgi:fructose-1,6-bisphosphatase-3
MGGPMEQSYEQKYLLQLAKEFPTVQEVSTELINLTAILNLPKGTEHFLSDIHGEYETFNHFLKNGSGVIMDKISILFPEKSIEDFITTNRTCTIDVSKIHQK